MAKPKQSQVKSKRKLLNPVFHLQTKQEDERQLTDGMIKIVRRSGQLNLSGRSLATVPQRMFTMYQLRDEEVIADYDFNKRSDEGSWWDFKPLEYVDLSSNVLHEIPELIRIFQDLAVLNLQDNNLTTLPPEIGALTKLTKLNLSHNKINKLPEEFYKLTDLRMLLISHNNLETVPKEFCDLVSLQQLDMSHNNLIALPHGIGFLARLTDINLSHNKLTELPSDITSIRALIKLDVTHNELKNLPSLCELKKLQSLYAQHNDIEYLPDFEGCEGIQQLYFGNNFIKEIPVHFCENMSHLKILELRDNKIESLPDKIAMLQRVVRLDLTNNELSTLPNSLSLLPHLQNLQIEGNKLKQIRSDIVKGGTCRILKHLRENFDSESIRQVPETDRHPIRNRAFPDRYSMKSTRSLNLSSQELTKIPDSIFEEAEKAEVTIVDICKNNFTEIPNGLKIIAANVTELMLCTNQFKIIPDFMSECVKLQYLDLGNNALSSLPESLSSLVRLRELVLSNNRFVKLPECVYEMQSLEILNASYNQIAQIDVTGLKRLKSLATLNLTNNDINSVPLELGNLTQLRCLELKGNRFRQPRYAVLEQGTDSILSYLRDRIPR